MCLKLLFYAVYRKTKQVNVIRFDRVQKNFSILNMSCLCNKVLNLLTIYSHTLKLKIRKILKQIITC